MNLKLLAGLGLALALVPVLGCATPQFGTFPDAVHACRLVQPGQMSRKRSLPPTSPGVAACLARHGWSADGTRRASPAPTTDASK